MKAFRQFMLDDSGITAIEYALLAAAIAVAVAAAATALTGSFSATWTKITDVFAA